ncbi:MAG: efflux transporter outer membrane subunit [Nitrospirae bacterium]|nr:efflux transporter outer membrane subunit [Nitrospirota bacterium]
MKLNRVIKITIMTFLLSGCMGLGPDYVRPKIDTPEVWPGQTTNHSLSAEWWKVYHDPGLEKIVEDSLLHNLDLALAIARVDEARGTLGLTRADQLPDFSVSGIRSRNRGSQSSVLGIPQGTDPVYDNIRATLNTSFEIDLWGKYRRASEAARANLLATEFNRESVKLALISEVARGYFNLRALDAKVAVTRTTLSSRLVSLNLQRLRYEAGLASELELRQVEAETAAAEALLPTLENQLGQQETALSVLLGRTPREIVNLPVERGSALEALTVPPPVPAGLPSDLLEFRPDIRQAEQQLVAANARIGQAKAAYFPSISLTGFLGGESPNLTDLFSAPAAVWQVSSSVSQKIFDAGRTGSNVEAAKARQREMLAAYQSAIQNAFRDTLNALVAQRKSRETLEAEFKRAKALESALNLAKIRYDNGVASQLDVLDAERGLLDAELSRIEAQRAQLAATVDLFKALGGGWK